jgi:thiamine biosynthesis lipoprotein
MRLSMKNNALVTSGSYIRYFEIAGKRYHHLIDPETAHPADAFVSVSILGPDSGVCDALSTALFVMTKEEGEALIENLDGYEAVWICSDGKILKSAGMDAYILSK